MASTAAWTMAAASAPMRPYGHMIVVPGFGIEAAERGSRGNADAEEEVEAEDEIAVRSSGTRGVGAEEAVPAELPGAQAGEHRQQMHRRH